MLEPARGIPKLLGWRWRNSNFGLVRRRRLDRLSPAALHVHRERVATGVATEPTGDATVATTTSVADTAQLADSLAAASVGAAPAGAALRCWLREQPLQRLRRDRDPARPADGLVR